MGWYADGSLTCMRVLFTISTNWPALRDVSLGVRKAPRHQSIGIKRCLIHSGVPPTSFRSSLVQHPVHRELRGAGVKKVEKVTFLGKRMSVLLKIVMWLI